MDNEKFRQLQQQSELAEAEVQGRKLAERLAFLEARNRELERLHKSVLHAEGAAQDYVNQVRDAVQATEPYPRIELPRHKSSGSPIHAVLNLSDWQIGEVINPLETEGFGNFNWDIAQERVLGQLVPKFTGWVDFHRKEFSIDTLDIFGIGDWISGDIHDELRVTNEFPSPVQTAKAGLLLGETVRRLAPHFKEIRLWEVGGDNHGRLVKKPQAKQKTLNSFNYLVYTIANQTLAEHSNVTIMRKEQMKTIAEVNGWRFLLQHGDGIKMHMGIPYYGIERERAREAVKRIRTDKEFDYMCIGHFHTPTILGGFMYINGALTGTTEFDHSLGRHADPAQVSFLVHPRWGIFDWVQWRFKK